MKPELNAMYEASIKPESGIDAIRNVFISSLHWRGDELWAGPWIVGYAYTRPHRDVWRFGLWEGCERQAPTQAEARAALEAAAKKQINEWFEEQAK